MTFTAGDVVVLRSGGEPMTVIGVDNDEAMCIWTGDEGELFRESIPTIALQVAQPLTDDEEEEDEEDETEAA